jgi:hypothetical protein
MRLNIPRSPYLAPVASLLAVLAAVLIFVYMAYNH